MCEFSVRCNITILRGFHSILNLACILVGGCPYSFNNLFLMIRYCFNDVRKGLHWNKKTSLKPMYDSLSRKYKVNLPRSEQFMFILIFHFNAT